MAVKAKRRTASIKRRAASAKAVKRAKTRKAASGRKAVKRTNPAGARKAASRGKPKSAKPAKKAATKKQARKAPKAAPPAARKAKPVRAAVAEAPVRRKVVAAAPATAKRVPGPPPQPAAQPPQVTEQVAAPLKEAPVAEPERESPGERIGAVTHYFGEPSVAVIHLESGMLRVGDTVHIKGHTTDLTQRVESLQVEHETVDEVGPQDNFGMKVTGHVREHDIVYKLK